MVLAHVTYILITNNELCAFHNAAPLQNYLWN